MSPSVLAALRQRREVDLAPAAPARLELLLADAPAPVAGTWAPAGGLPAVALEEPLPAPRALRPQVPVALQHRRDDNWLAWRVGRVLPDPFGVLFERHWRPLYAFCLSFVGAREEAEDAAQEAFARAYAVLSARRDQPDFRPWLFQIARNACLDRLRESRRRDIAGDGLDEDALGSGDAPADVLERRHGVRTLLADLGALSERQRAALVLRELSGMSHDEIAATLATTPARSKSLVSEARQALGERRAGRDLGCDEYRSALARSGSRNPRGHRLVAHHESCVRCRRPRRPGMLSIFPLPVFAPAFDALRRLFGAGAHAGHAAGQAAAAKLAVVGAVAAVATPVAHEAAVGGTEPVAPAGAPQQEVFSGGTAPARPSFATAAGGAIRQRSRTRDAADRNPDEATPREAFAGLGDDVGALLEARVGDDATALVRERVPDRRALAEALSGALADELARLPGEAGRTLERTVRSAPAALPLPLPRAADPRAAEPRPARPAPRRRPATPAPAPGRAPAPALPLPAPPATDELLDVPSAAERAIDALGLGGPR